MNTVLVCVVLVALAVATAAQDPASSWLSYAEYSADDSITFLAANWTVPAYPSDKFASRAPGFWISVENADNTYLVQPILAFGDGDLHYTCFNGWFVWSGPHAGWHQSQAFKVVPGDAIYASITYLPSTDEYEMYIACEAKGQSVTTKVPAQGVKYPLSYFVVEHQSSCSGLPADGKVTWTNIEVEVANNRVTPTWQAKQEDPVCSSQAHILSPSSIQVTWDA
ncbi:uncharacterized protein AMSG_11038 [Thecamonas trahens ATCC 50062]|uniref:Uncharacterized protein n=1 Tax=Thecamonas trahens ATCC 50062 TaxID=461836 RepID=A0A0L0DTJ7_THETB|nr:hypothetical protein AMSG_11038 [Thecamonas trahens ATCC 50062]KNC55381.1 hypothetical protein AMSG_11038 [Thecamonas trahens ATCC 50062]|eukprot:XP_013753014.1 hypothetical protein AMSG_11038 [Thecamonas trahens ATCC 50062]